MRNKIQAITLPQSCTGCGLCANVCGHDAIHMEWNGEGFLVPRVNAKGCINCGACVKACPAQPEHLAKLRSASGKEGEPKVYGAWHTNKVTQLCSSSGGIFTALAEHVFRSGGCVFGVVWENKDSAVYARAENPAELDAMRGAKYTQAVPGMVYRQVREELRKGRQVLFCGTPCQVYALRRYLRREYENLLLVDILCHGVPSRHLLQSYIRQHERLQKKKLTGIQFRVKAGNWLQYQVKKDFADGSSTAHCNREDMFMRLFTDDHVLNVACYNCPHARLPRLGDITIGDFWGITEETHPEWPIRDGISSVLENTTKGRDLLRHLSQQNILRLHAESFTNLYNGQPFTYMRSQVVLPAGRRKALRQLRRKKLLHLYQRSYLQEKCGPFMLIHGSVAHRLYLRGQQLIKGATSALRRIVKRDLH